MLAFIEMRAFRPTGEAMADCALPVGFSSTADGVDIRINGSIAWQHLPANHGTSQKND
ncbi:MAG: hypothetical protein KDJ68_10375 [Rhodobiaceae bacterium]|nr:hypothetical protein [Rhodobiaceae bacterium]